MKNLEGLVPLCCWFVQSERKLKRNVELNDFNKHCYDVCKGYDPRCPNYHPMDGGHSRINLDVV